MERKTSHFLRDLLHLICSIDLSLSQEKISSFLIDVLLILKFIQKANQTRITKIILKSIGRLTVSRFKS